MKHPKHPGIYAIRHIDSGSVYIGSSRNICVRWRGHRTKLRNGKHHCAHLQNAWDKYGECSFVFEVTETCFDDPVVLFHREQVWMDRFRSKLYNMASQSEPRCGTKWTEERRKFMSERMKGNRYGEGHHSGKLKESDILSILHDYASGMTIKDIATKHSIDKSSVDRITSRKRWGDIAIPEDLASAIRIRKSPEYRSTNHLNRRFTFQVAEKIREEHSRGTSKDEIMSSFGISEAHARNILNRSAWKNPPAVLPSVQAIPVVEPVKIAPIEKAYRPRKSSPSKGVRLKAVMISCDHCGMEFYRIPAQIKGHDNHFCSVPCKQVALGRLVTGKNWRFSILERDAIRERIRSGESLTSIARGFSVSLGVITRVRDEPRTGKAE